MRQLFSPPGMQPDGTAWRPFYQRPHVSALGGGAVYQPPRWRESAGGEEGKVARLLADNGYDVVLLQPGRTPDVKTPDAVVIADPGRGEDSQFWEFKRLTGGATNAQEYAQRSIREGKKQAPTILLFLSEDVTPLGGMGAINRGVLNALRHDVQRKVEKVVTLGRDGAMQILSRKELEDGQRFSELQGHNQPRAGGGLPGPGAAGAAGQD